MKHVKPVLFVLPLVVAAGCVQSHRHPPVVYTTVPAAVVAPPAPTSDLPAVRVYPEAPPAAPAVVTPPGISTQDLAVADSIRQVLKGQGALAGVAKNVEATVDGGLVTLRGVVPTESDREEIASRIARLPGVDRLNNELRVELR